ncbi:hypothetical protein CGRA01v4_02117 [Colletotrichum graminicola]|nr:hypothetical protein CGRA01v4_02117 [Colletotrichum graminicola]
MAIAGDPSPCARSGEQYPCPSHPLLTEIKVGMDITTPTSPIGYRVPGSGQPAGSGS